MKQTTNFLLAFNFLFLSPLCNGSSQTDEPDRIRFTVLQKSTTSWDTKTLPKYLNGQPEITIIRVIIPPKTNVASHKHELINFGYLVRGELEATSEDGETILLSEGDTIIELVNSWHSAKNQGDKEVELIVFYLGPSTKPFAIYKYEFGDG